MILMRLVVIAGALGLSGPAFADAWSARPVLLPERSKQSCQSLNPEAGNYELNYDGAVLSGINSRGAKFATSAAADGSVKVSLDGGSEKSPQLELNGNAKTRNLTIYNPRTGCRWKLAPLTPGRATDNLRLQCLKICAENG
jgi:hypothetical protein